MRTMIAAVSLLAFGCTESVESNDVRTSGVYPEIAVTATGNGSSQVRVRLKVGGNNSNTFLDLSGMDRLEATVGDDTNVLDETSSDTYTTTFPTDAEGTEFTIGSRSRSCAERTTTTRPPPP
jgi:hypothetical protein